MRYHISGYFMTFQEARKVATNLGIDVDEDNKYNNLHLELVINDWLCDHNKLEVKSALISWPNMSRNVGIIFITHFRRMAPRHGEEGEREEDRRVKEWLMDSGARPEEMHWASLWDERGTITLDGTEPRRSYDEGKGPVPVTYYGGPGPDPSLAIKKDQD